ncbi:hypothetical protein CLOLEP_03337 [[Clostridium] leptum DSM 753]|uniref:Uncharacterized protein n=1 Tax=[Clostridium] leptum DSM 753 TaxID=428125 RepID=A7VXL2_9FIRM|nr:hypothetical protein CLOLEP_03337 [[Clostridium] leptum DSM 753]
MVSLKKQPVFSVNRQILEFVKSILLELASEKYYNETNICLRS